MQIVNTPIDAIKPYPNNPRINEGGVDAVAKSIQEFGWQQPIVVDKDGVIIVGHTRYKAAQKLGLDKVPVVTADKLSDKQVKAYRLADNKVADKTIWDNKKLLDELDGIGDDVFTGFTTSDIFDDVLDETQDDVLQKNEAGVTYSFSLKTQNKQLFERVKELVETYE
ncbi:ParB N-terminal domain-containing protein [Ligilactobacillus sp. LYQ139]|uniref:ParB N-terminal domain-containing protein n=1 Tax=Ligilactobacillus sp. LYQ139 TaxID=3378800 RepID=UPI003853721D